MYEFAEVQNKGHEGSLIPILSTIVAHINPLAIIAFREKLFKSVPHRDHPVVKFFTFGPDDLNLMCYGRVGYKYPEGTTNMKEWAGRYKLIKTDTGALKFKYVQVIIVEIQSLKTRLQAANIIAGSSRPWRFQRLKGGLAGFEAA